MMRKMEEGDDSDIEVLQKMDSIIKDLREKECELQDLDALNQTLVVKERKSNDELQDARKELINVSPFISIIIHAYPLTILFVARIRFFPVKLVISNLFHSN